MVCNLIAVAAVVLIVCAFAWDFHRISKPLTRAEVETLVEKRRYDEISHYFGFQRSRQPLDLRFKASMKPDGAFHRVDYSLDVALSTVAAHLKYKKHEWVVFLYCREKRVVLVWCNKGPDATTVWPTIKVSSIVKQAIAERVSVVIRAHNHPNEFSGRVSLLHPSEQDLRSAKFFGDTMLTNNLNFLDVVCERGYWRVFHERFLESFVPREPLLAAVTDANGKSKKGNRQLHRELRARYGLSLSGKKAA